ADRNRSHWSTSKTPSYTKSVSWQHHRYSRSRQRRSPVK
ncbi:transposase, partial [Escherichia coli]